jgi:hypothetical protein
MEAAGLPLARWALLLTMQFSCVAALCTASLAALGLADLRQDEKGTPSSGLPQ